MKRTPLFKLAIAAVALFEIALSASSRGQNVTATFTNTFGDAIWQRDAHIGVIGNPNDPPAPGNWDTGAYPNNGHHITDPNTAQNIPGDNPFYDVVIALPSCMIGPNFGVVIQTLNLANGSTLGLIEGSTVAIANGTLTNNGMILVNTTAVNNTAKVRFDANGLITGSGAIVLNDSGNVFNVADVDIQNFTVTHDVNHTIRGHGTIIGFNSGTLINNGTINGDSTTGSMQVDLSDNANENNSLIEATNGAVTLFGAGTINQTGGGTLLADGNGSSIQFYTGNNGTRVPKVIGGIVTTANGGIARVGDPFNQAVIFEGVTNNGTVQIPMSDLIVVTGSGLTNNGTILVNTTGENNTTAIRFDANGTLGGTGTVTLKSFGDSFNTANVNLQNFTVTHGGTHTIRGRGTIIGFNGGTLINNRPIIADDPVGSLQLDLANTANTNNTTIKAINGAALTIGGGTIDQTGGGTLLADGNGSSVQFYSGPTIIGGITTTANGGIVRVGDPFNQAVTFQGVTNNGTVQIPTSDLIAVTGSGLTNNGTILVNTTGENNTTAIRFDANGTLGGNGTVTLKGIGTSFNVANVNLQNFTVTHGANHTIHGKGTVIGFNGATLINNGTINGDDANGGSMQLDLANTSNQNNATIKATSGGLLGLYSGTIDQTGGGTLLADGNNSVVQLGSGFVTVVGGILNTTNNGIIQVTPAGAGVGLTSVTNNGTLQIPGGEIIVVTGTGLTNNGTVLVDTNADNSTTRVRFDADGTLGGTGSLTLNGILGVFNVAGFDCNGHAVVNGSSHTIKGNGNIFMNGGSLTNNGTIAPGLSPGRLDFNGNLVLGSTSNLLFEIGGAGQGTTYDWLNKTDGGAQTLGGNLTVRLINNFVPGNSDRFTILTTQTILQGSFLNVPNGGRLYTEEGKGSFKVTYNVLNDALLSRNVTLSDFKPRPVPATPTPTPTPRPTPTPKPSATPPPTPTPTPTPRPSATPK